MSDPQWIREWLRQFNHWPDRSRTGNCADGFCGSPECRTCGAPRKKPVEDDSEPEQEECVSDQGPGLATDENR